MSRSSIAFVVATRNRPAELRRLLASLAGQVEPDDAVVVVDSSDLPDETLATELPSLAVTYRRHGPPSASAQRNAGIALVPDGVPLVAFLDDDAVLEDGALDAMRAFWATASDEVGGAGFDLRNFEPPPAGRLKRSRLADRLGLYATRPGAVAPSGWQSLIGHVAETVEVDWLPSGAVVWRRDVLGSVRFEEAFDRYSYLEDLDFSLAARAAGWRLAVVADAGYRHLPSHRGRVSGFGFGRVEVRNRLLVVRKHGLSTWRCVLGLKIRVAMTLLSALRLRPGAPSRLAGNLVEMVATPVRLVMPRRRRP